MNKYSLGMLYMGCRCTCGPKKQKNPRKTQLYETKNDEEWPMRVMAASVAKKTPQIIHKTYQFHEEKSWRFPIRDVDASMANKLLKILGLLCGQKNI